MDTLEGATSKAEDGVPDELARLRFFRERTAKGRNVTSDQRENLYCTILRLRHMGASNAEIARQLGISERNFYYHLRNAKVWFGERLTERLDPFELLMAEFVKLDMVDERALSGIMQSNLSVPDFQKMATVALKVSEMRAAWLERYGYFDSVNFHSITGGDADSAEARADLVRKALNEVFGEDPTPG